MSTDMPIEVDVPTVHGWLESRHDMALIDCREPSEAEVAVIPGAILLPMSQWASVAPQLEELKGKHLVVHCHHGGRSLRVAQWLRANGFPEAQSMAGGIDAWSEMIDPSLPRY